MTARDGNAGPNRAVTPYVRPFVKRRKNDAADAEATVIAVRQPEIRVVEPRTPDQQAGAVVFRSHEGIVHQRTELVNAVLHECGQIIPIGIVHGKFPESLAIEHRRLQHRKPAT